MKSANKLILLVCFSVLCMFYIQGCDNEGFTFVPLYNYTKYQMVVIVDGSNQGHLEPAGLKQIYVEKGIRHNLRLRFIDDTDIVWDITGQVWDGIKEINVIRHQNSYTLNYIPR